AAWFEARKGLVARQIAQRVGLGRRSYQRKGVGEVDVFLLVGVLVNQRMTRGKNGRVHVELGGLLEDLFLLIEFGQAASIDRQRRMDLGVSGEHSFPLAIAKH